MTLSKSFFFSAVSLFYRIKNKASNWTFGDAGYHNPLDWLS